MNDVGCFYVNDFEIGLLKEQTGHTKHREKDDLKIVICIPT